MAKIFITGSTDGLGLLSARSLIKQGHTVVLHARNAERGNEISLDSGAQVILTADLSNMGDTKNLAHELNKLSRFDAIIHNAGVYQASSKEIFAVNTLAPYILTCLVQKPKRLIYLSSGMHMYGHWNPLSFRPDSHISYSDSKLHVVMLCLAVARKWKDVFANAVNPGWVPTKMGGKSAPDNLQKGYETQSWLAVSNDIQAKMSGQYFFHKRIVQHNPEADNEKAQDKFLSLCEELTGVSMMEDKPVAE